MITRKDLTQHRLDKLWIDQGQQLQKYISVDPLPPAVVFEEYDSPYALSDAAIDVTARLPRSDTGGITYSAGRDLGDDSEGKLDISM